jgi:ribosomal protein L11 methyltransferase
MAAADEWTTVRVEIAPALAEPLASFLFDHGAGGVLTEDVAAGRVRVEASVPAGELARVSAALARWLESLGALDPDARAATVEAVPVPALDWAALARRHHRPLPVGRRLLVAPPWDVPRSAGREVLVIEPGMAFGTGGHATTRGCLEAIETAVAGGRVASALDVGTGSGILALALARLGVRRVVAIDVDPAVVPIARANLARNGAAGVAVAVGSMAAVRAAFDLVVANLLADVVIAEAPRLARAVAAGGVLVLSGILEAQAPAVRAAYAGWRVVAERLGEGWTTVTLTRDSV